MTTPEQPEKIDRENAMAELDEAMMEKALHARVPGGSEVWHWLPQKSAYEPSQTARDVMSAALTAILPDLREQHYAECRRAALEEALAQQPCTAENPNESDYERGRFDGIVAFAQAIRALIDKEPT